MHTGDKPKSILFSSMLLMCSIMSEKNFLAYINVSDFISTPILLRRLSNLSSGDGCVSSSDDGD